MEGDCLGFILDVWEEDGYFTASVEMGNNSQIVSMKHLDEIRPGSWVWISQGEVVSLLDQSQIWDVLSSFEREGLNPSGQWFETCLAAENRFGV